MLFVLYLFTLRAEKASSADLQAISSVLDRTLGETSQLEVNMTTAQQAVDIIRALDECDARQVAAASDAN